jgi:DNA-binding transcriptional LysR family regulator
MVALVVERGSFTAAAASRGVTQPAVSMQVRQLETRLGVRLVERVGRRAQATPAGREILSCLPAIEDAIVRADAALAPFREGEAGRIRLGTGATACIYLLPPILRRLRERMEGLDIVVRTANTIDVLRMVEENEIDLGLVTLPARHRGLEITPLLEDPLTAIFPADRAPATNWMTARDLASIPIALYEPSGETRRLIEDWFAAGGVRPRPIMELGSIEAIKRLVGAGLCAAIVPRLALESDAEGVFPVPLRPALSRTLALAMRRDKRLDRGLREVLQLLRALPNAKGRPSRTGPPDRSVKRRRATSSPLPPEPGPG